MLPLLSLLFVVLFLLLLLLFLLFLWAGLLPWGRGQGEGGAGHFLP